MRPQNRPLSELVAIRHAVNCTRAPKSHGRAACCTYVGSDWLVLPLRCPPRLSQHPPGLRYFAPVVCWKAFRAVSLCLEVHAPTEAACYRR
jgi:hypothetical protein